MRSYLLGFLSVIALCTLSCSHSGKTDADPRQPAMTSGGNYPGKIWSKNDPALRAGDLTIWKLQSMASEGRFDELNALFNQGYSMDRLPTGYSAGTGARVLGLGQNVAGELLEKWTGQNWRGKYFFTETPNKSRGVNRIRRIPFIKEEPIVPMGNFVTEMLERHPLVPDATSNIVLLNYAKPRSKPPYMVENILTKVQVYDIMVAVPGKYGPIYVGKTWLGRYNPKTSEFKALEPDKLIAWYFLDFNPEALAEQTREHWDGAKEIYVSDR